MATLSVVVPDDQLDRVRHALCAAAGLPDSTQNARKALVDHIKVTVRRVEFTEAEEEALASVIPPYVDDIVE